NMWFAVAFFNPVIGLLSLCVLPLNNIVTVNQNDLLAAMGQVAGGRWLKIMVSIDAAVVLSGKGCQSSFV
ncbi:unnamed protein product, partial [Symbiodinium sp. KB8]